MKKEFLKYNNAIIVLKSELLTAFPMQPGSDAVGLGRRSQQSRCGQEMAVVVAHVPCAFSQNFDVTYPFFSYFSNNLKISLVIIIKFLTFTLLFLR